MEELVDTVATGAVWGVGFALAALAVRSLGRGSRPLARNVMRGALAAGDWMKHTTSEGRERLQDIYQEAKAEREQETVQQA